MQVRMLNVTVHSSV